MAQGFDRAAIDLLVTGRADVVALAVRGTGGGNFNLQVVHIIGVLAGSFDNGDVRQATGGTGKGLLAVNQTGHGLGHFARVPGMLVRLGNRLRLGIVAAAAGKGHDAFFLTGGRLGLSAVVQSVAELLSVALFSLAAQAARTGLNAALGTGSSSGRRPCAEAVIALGRFDRNRTRIGRCAGIVFVDVIRLGNRNGQFVSACSKTIVNLDSRRSELTGGNNRITGTVDRLAGCLSIHRGKAEDGAPTAANANFHIGCIGSVDINRNSNRITGLRSRQSRSAQQHQQHQSSQQSYNLLHCDVSFIFYSIVAHHQESQF